MRTVNGCILLLAAISITFAAVSGAYHLDMQQLLALILRQENVPVQEQIVFWQIRVPRILAALFLGAALAGAGTTYQGMLRNPLVSPDILGVSAGAGLGACAAILWGLSIVYIQLYAFCGGLMVVAGVWLITRRVTRHDPILTLVLVGIASVSYTHLTPINRSKCHALGLVWYVPCLPFHQLIASLPGGCN